MNVIVLDTTDGPVGYRGVFKKIAGALCLIEDADIIIENLKLPDAEPFKSINHKLHIEMVSGSSVDVWITPHIGRDAHDIALELSKIFPGFYFYIVGAARILAEFTNGEMIRSRCITEFYEPPIDLEQYQYKHS